MALRADVWILAARPKTLWAAVSPVLIGIAMAAGDGSFHATAGFLAMLAAVLIQIGTNYHNDYEDFARGADTSTRQGPTRAVHAGLVAARTMKRAAIATFVAAVIAGTYLMIRGGWPIVIIGASSIVFAVLYTGGRYSLANLGLADIIVFIFFGPVAVAGTYYVQSLTWPPQVWIAGVGPGALSVAILMVNNIRDVEEDRLNQKRTLVVRFGRKFGVISYAACVLVAAATPFYLYFAYGGPLPAIIAVIIIPLSIPVVRTLMSTPVNEGMRLNPVLAATGRLLLIYSLCFSIGWMLG